MYLGTFKVHLFWVFHSSWVKFQLESNFKIKIFSVLRREWNYLWVENGKCKVENRKKKICIVNLIAIECRVNEYNAYVVGLWSHLK